MEMSEAPFFSIVIPSLNEEKYLPKLLEDLAAQTYTHFEVIHVDGNSEDGTVAATKPFKEKIPLVTVSTPIRNVSRQRNLGIEKAKGEWILFMDSDNRLPSYFLDGVRYQLAKKPNLDVFTTWIMVEEEEALDGAVCHFINLGFELYKQLGREAALGALIGARTSLARELQFDETQKVFEDAFFVQQAAKRGYHFEVLKEPRYYFSLRRLRTEGKLKMARMVAIMGIQYIQGKSFDTNDYGYVMRGGSYYDSQDDTVTLFQSLQDFVKKASSHQLKQMQDILRKIKEYVE